MNPMDHAEAHEWIADLAIEPAWLAALRSRPSDDDTRLLAHVSGCDTCRADLEAWTDVQHLLADALAPDGNEAMGATATSPMEPIRVPADLRDRVLNVGRAGTRAGTGPTPIAVGRPRAVRAPRWAARAALAVAAALVVLVGAGTIRDQQSRLDAARAEAQSLAGVMGALDRLLTTPDHAVAALLRTDGTAGGSVSWSGQDIVVLTTALQAPAAGQVYRCWIEQGGQRTPIGLMEFAAGTAYWSGSLDQWATVSLGSGSRIGVSLEPSASGVSGPAVLLASLGS
jgi:hypothetical protein